MEPITLVMMLCLALLSGGATTRHVYLRAQHLRREALREALTEPLAVLSDHVSIFDLFWDLGVSDFALEIMAHQRLLPARPEDLAPIAGRIDDGIDIHGSYEAFIHDMLEAIQEFYEEHRAAGQRRILPTLSLPAVRLLPLPPAPQGASESTEQQQVDDQDFMPDGLLLDLKLEERTRLRAERAAPGQGPGGLSALLPQAGEEAVDLDDLLRVGPLHLLSGLLRGDFKARLSRWSSLRRLRKLRDQLDLKLLEFAAYFERFVERDATFFAPLYDLSHRWEREALRIERLAIKRPWRERDHALAADLLMQEARLFALHLMRHAAQNAEEASAAILSALKRGDRAMAGYLVYANRYALFAGRGDDHAQLISEVEYAAERVQHELRALRGRGIV